jgi:hypothetical protein
VTVDEDEILHRYGLRPAPEHLNQIRDLLRTQTERERQSQGGGDTEVMKLCCVQLFNAGVMSDVLTIWRAKSSSWDASCSIDVRLLCGGGLAETKAYLLTAGSEDAARVLEYIRHGENAGDFADFSVAKHAASYAAYYALEASDSIDATKAHDELTSDKAAFWDHFYATFDFRPSHTSRRRCRYQTPAVPGPYVVLLEVDWAAVWHLPPTRLTHQGSGRSLRGMSRRVACSYRAIGVQDQA